MFFIWICAFGSWERFWILLTKIEYKPLEGKRGVYTKPIKSFSKLHIGHEKYDHVKLWHFIAELFSINVVSSVQGVFRLMFHYKWNRNGRLKIVSATATYIYLFRLHFYLQPEFIISELKSQSYIIT